MSGKRLASGGLIDRGKAVSFSFDGKSYSGHPGDTLASALIANGVSLVGRSFKYHRPRGILGAGVEEPNALVELRSGARREPNTRATQVELFDGLEARSQNRWPSLRFDLMAVNSIASPLIGAGFYYKTFMWPAAFWEKLYEPLIRRAAGLGRAAREADPDCYEKANAFCDVLVIGAGPAGLMAALTAARAGARVILADEDFAAGGRLLSDARSINDAPALDWTQAALAELGSLPDARLFTRTTVFGAYDHGVYAAVERVNDHFAAPPAHQPRQRLWRIVAKRAILTAGAIERPLVFADNDRPGIMLSAAVRSYINRFGAAPGQRAVVFTNNDDAVRTALDHARHGLRVEAVVDPRAVIGAEAAAALKLAGIERLHGAVERAHCGSLFSRPRVHGADVRLAGGERLALACDLIAMSGGWSPSLHLTSHQGGRPAWREDISAFVPGSTPPGMAAAGAANGSFGLGEALAEGAREGAAAAEAAGFAAAQPNLPSADAEWAGRTPLWRVASKRGKAFIDFQNDVTDKDIEIAGREGFRRAEHLKRYTTLGMATDQGKTANINGLAIMAEITQTSIESIGTTRFRPPYTAVSFGALAGRERGGHLRPRRLTPAHQWAAELGAVFIETGAWMRASHFEQPGDKDWFDAALREAAAVRKDAGICDVSTLGKVEIFGRDAAAFLDFVYCNTFSTLPIGKARYGLMLREDGFIFDDGTTSRLGENHYLMTTTTAHAGEVMQHLEFVQQCLKPHLDVRFASVTEQWAQFSIAGPKARALVERIVDPGQDISNQAFPYMAAGGMNMLGGIAGRLFRISFSGELAYEIAVPARYGDALARALMRRGQDLGAVPYGLEALTMMRIEKGHVGGAEISGQTTPRDAGLGKMMSVKKDFIGRRMNDRPALTDPERPILIGVKPVDPSKRIRSGAHFISRGSKPGTASDEGYVTSAHYSVELKLWIGLGLLKNGRGRIGEKIIAYDQLRGEEFLVEVCDQVFIDPKGERLRA